MTYMPETRDAHQKIKEHRRGRLIVGETGGIGSGSFVHFSGWLSYADDVPEIRAHQKKQSIGGGMIVGP